MVPIDNLARVVSYSISIHPILVYVTVFEIFDIKAVKLSIVCSSLSKWRAQWAGLNCAVVLSRFSNFNTLSYLSDRKSA